MKRMILIAAASVGLAACVPVGPGGNPVLPGVCGFANLPNPQIQWPNSPIGGPLPPFNRTAFENFIATAPSQQQFASRYPNIALVMPNDMATMELRYNYSRFFANTGPQGCIVGGGFR